MKRLQEMFTKERLRELVADQKSRLCVLAEDVYAAWKDPGVDFRDFLLRRIGVNPEHADLIVDNYSPSRPPAEVCPISAIHGGTDVDPWNIFQWLGLSIDSINPHNLLGWYALRIVLNEGIDDPKKQFDFCIEGSDMSGGKDNKVIFRNFPLGPDGEPVPFGVAGLNVFTEDGLPAHALRKASRLVSVLGDTGRDLARALIAADMIFPPSRVTDQLVGVIERGLGGETVVLTGAFCPDYAYRPTGNREVPYEYTFEGIGSGVGLVAQQFVRMIPVLSGFFDRHGISYRIKLGIGDFEANSPEILRRVGLNREEFIGRCALSLDAFRKSLGMIPRDRLDLVLFEQQWANGRWKKSIEDARKRMAIGDFGHIREATGKDPMTEIVRFIAKASAAFYQKWYGRQMTEDEIVDLVLDQGAEYAAMGRILAQDFSEQPVIQLAGDRPKMQAFNAMYAPGIVTLCAKRTY